MRRCLDCPTLIHAGSRCQGCRRAYERAKSPQRSGYSRTTWAKAVKDRDGWRCRVAGCQTPTDRVQAHHVRELINGGADTLSNGLTLCHRHHLEAHHR